MANPTLNRISTDIRQGGTRGVLTLDSVVQKTSITVGLLVLAAMGTWWLMGDAIERESMSTLSTIGMVAFVSSLAACGLSFFISFRRGVSAPLILLFSVLEGVAIGALSRVAALQVGSMEPVVGAVLGTFVAVAATLLVYKTTGLRTTDKIRRFVTIAMFAFVGIGLVDLALHFFGAGFGVNGFGATGALFSAVGLVIALFMLYMDFEAVEGSIAYGAPDEEGWRLAFGLTVTLVWLYVNMLKILTYFQQR